VWKIKKQSRDAMGIAALFFQDQAEQLALPERQEPVQAVLSAIQFQHQILKQMEN
jgi:hypothetical protein